jgi:hypothetical protein
MFVYFCFWIFSFHVSLFVFLSMSLSTWLTYLKNQLLVASLQLHIYYVHGPYLPITFAWFISPSFIAKYFGFYDEMKNSSLFVFA